MQNDYNQDPFENENISETEKETNAEEMDPKDVSDAETMNAQGNEAEDIQSQPENPSFQPESFQSQNENAQTQAGSFQSRTESSGTQTDSFQTQSGQSYQDQSFGSRPEERFSYHREERHENQQDIPRWTPYEEPRQSAPNPRKPQGSKKRWVIPLIVVLSIMVIAIIVGVIFGTRSLSAYVNNATTEIQKEKEEETTKDTASISTSDKDSSKSFASGKFILTDVSEVVNEVMPSVVSITSRSLVENGGYGDYWNFFFGSAFGGNSGGGESREVDSGIGSGTIVSQNSTELLILTSYHVVEGSSSLYVTFMDGSAVDGYIKSQSEENDIAIVAVPLSDLSQETLDSISYATLSREEVEVGDGTIVIGNALGYGISVTTGIISATDRTIKADGKTLNVLQTDAAINAGNSGGCVLNSNGEVIGISEAKIIISNVEGMCYAIPIASNLELIDSLLNETGETQVAENDPNSQGSGQGAYLGIRGRDIDNNLANSYGMPKGIYVASTLSGSGAEQAGLLEGDIIVGMDNVSFSTMDELQSQLSRHNPGDVVTLIIMRETNGKYSQVKVEVTLSDSISS